MDYIVTICPISENTRWGILIEFQFRTIKWYIQCNALLYTAITLDWTKSTLPQIAMRSNTSIFYRFLSDTLLAIIFLFRKTIFSYLMMMVIIFLGRRGNIFCWNCLLYWLYIKWYARTTCLQGFCVHAKVKIKIDRRVFVQVKTIPWLISTQP